MSALSQIDGTHKPCPVCSVAAAGPSRQSELVQQEQDMAAFLEAFPSSRAARLAELEGMQLASRASNRAGLDPATLAAMEAQVRPAVMLPTAAHFACCKALQSYSVSRSPAQLVLAVLPLSGLLCAC